MNILYQRNTCKAMFIVTLIKIAKTWNQLKYPSQKPQRMSSIHTQFTCKEYDCYKKRMKQKQKDKYIMFVFQCDKKIQKKETKQTYLDAFVLLEIKLYQTLLSVCQTNGQEYCTTTFSMIYGYFSVHSKQKKLTFFHFIFSLHLLPCLYSC